MLKKKTKENKKSTIAGSEHLRDQWNRPSRPRATCVIRSPSPNCAGCALSSWCANVCVMPQDSTISNEWLKIADAVQPQSFILRIYALALPPISLKSFHTNKNNNNNNKRKGVRRQSHLPRTLYRTPSKLRTLKFERNESNSHIQRIKRGSLFFKWQLGGSWLLQRLRI